MAGDFSRSSVNPIRKYAGVLMQQGRVQVDADWNEQLALQLNRTHRETSDVIGLCGTPACGSGFEITPINGDLQIGVGDFYVNGLLCQLAPQQIPVSLSAVSWAEAPEQSLIGARYDVRLRMQSRRVPMYREPAEQAPEWNQVGEASVIVPSLWVDGRQLANGDWVIISASGVTSVSAQIVDISGNTADADPDSITPSFYTITINESLSGFNAASTIWLQRIVTFTSQPFLYSGSEPTVEASPLRANGLQLSDGDYAIVLEAWQTEVNALEDPHIREVALGGPDTAVRLQTKWQVQVVPYSQSSPIDSPLSSPLDCCADFPALDEYEATKQTTGLMNAYAPPAGPNLKPCQLPPDAGYLGLANQLYRVEVFRSGNAGESAAMVWSRDNAMVETSILCIDSLGIVYVNSLGTDDLHSFAQNDWVEIVSPQGDLLGQPRFLAQIAAPTGTSAQPPCSSSTSANPAFTVTLSPAPPQTLAGQPNLRLRRWDMSASTVMLSDVTGLPAGIEITPGWIQLENNIEVNFTDGFYSAGSYWQIPARTATGDIEWPPFETPNTNPIPQPPMGPQHFFCRLAVMTVQQGNWSVTDCRCTFPSLTNISTADISYSSSECELSQITTLDEALDGIAAKARFHNQMLHGNGVVNGLVVSCPCANCIPTSVGVSSGYAIDCDGYDLIVSESTNVDLATLIQPSPLGAGVPDGDYELILQRADGSESSTSSITSTGCGCPKKCAGSSGALTTSCYSFTAIPCSTDSLSQEVLNGTLLMDFYQGCLSQYVNKFKTDYSQQYVSPDKQVSLARALLSSGINLLYPKLNSAGSNPYISAAEGQQLEAFYYWLGALVTDTTLCSLTGDLPQFPQYFGSNSGMNTIFGKSLHTHLRLNAAVTGVAYTFGSDQTIHVYDLTSGQLATVVSMNIPDGATGWIVQDATFSQDGSQIFAIATAPNNTDSLFAVGNVNGLAIAWTAQSSVGALPFASLAIISENPTQLAASVPGQGLQIINVNGTTITATAGPTCNAVGHLAVYNTYLYASVNVPQPTTGLLGVVNRYALNDDNGGISLAPGPAPETTYTTANLPITITDDIVIYPDYDNGNYNNKLIWMSITVTPPAGAVKQLLTYDVASDETQSLSSVSLEVVTTTRLVADATRQSLMATFEDQCTIQEFTGSPRQYTMAQYAPSEVNPTSIAFTQDASGSTDLLVLNSTASTVLQINGNVQPFSQYDALQTYRTQVIAAYKTLLLTLLQSLKDSFCNLLLLGPPACNQAQGAGVSLGCITIKGGSVVKICDLEGRKYVKTFPGMGYWLSMIPIVPLISTWVERFCCLVLPNIFTTNASSGGTTSYNQVPSAPSGLAQSVKDYIPNGDSMRSTLSRFGKIDVSSLPSKVLAKATPAEGFVRDALLSSLKPTATTSVPSNSFVGVTEDSARTKLNAANINVLATQDYDPSNLSQNLATATTSPRSLAPGSSVTLVVDPTTQLVRNFQPTPAAVTTVDAQLSTVTENTQQLTQRIGVIEKLPIIAPILHPIAVDNPVKANPVGTQTPAASSTPTQTMSLTDLQNQIDTLQAHLNLLKSAKANG